jgi:hypothetical protein
MDSTVVKSALLESVPGIVHGFGDRGPQQQSGLMIVD